MDTRPKSLDRPRPEHLLEDPARVLFCIPIACTTSRLGATRSLASPRPLAWMSFRRRPNSRERRLPAAHHSTNCQKIQTAELVRQAHPRDDAPTRRPGFVRTTGRRQTQRLCNPEPMLPDHQKLGNTQHLSIRVNSPPCLWFSPVRLKSLTTDGVVFPCGLATSSPLDEMSEDSDGGAGATNSPPCEGLHKLTRADELQLRDPGFVRTTRRRQTQHLRNSDTPHTLTRLQPPRP